MAHRTAGVVAMLAAVAIMAAARRAEAGPPSGYSCGSDGTPVVGKGCRCAPDKVDARDPDDNAICVPRPARAPRPRAAPPVVHAAVEREAQCRAGTVASCAIAGKLHAQGDGVPRDAGKALALVRLGCDG